MTALRDIFQDPGKKAAILPILILGWAVPFCSVSFHIAFPSVTRELDISTVHTTWIPAAYLIAGAVIGLPISRITNRIGPRNAFMTGISTYIAGSVFASLAGDFRVLAVGFFAMGAGSTMLTLAGRALMWNTCSTEERTKLISLLVSLVSIGTLSGNFLGGLVIHFLHWRGIFAVGAAAGLACLFLVLRGIPAGDGDRSERSLDFPGVILYAVFIVTFLLGFSSFPHRTSLFLIPFALLMLLAFVMYESRVTKPILKLELFRTNTYFRFSSISMTFRQFTTYGIWILMSFYLQHVNSVSPAVTGIILGINAAVTAAMAAFSHRLKAWPGRATMINTGLVLNTAALVMLALLPRELDLVPLLGALIMLGIAAALTATTIPGLMLGKVPTEHRTMASATLNISKRLGSSLSMGTVMLFMSVLLGKAKLDGVRAVDFMVCMRAVMMVFAILSVVPLVYSIIHVMRRVRRERLEAARASADTRG